jgi:hypothetical protein
MTSHVERYLAKLEPEQVEIIRALRGLILESVPLVSEESTPDGRLLYRGVSPICFIQANDEHVELGFPFGRELAGAESSLVPGTRRPGTVKLHSSDDVWPDLFREVLRDAARLDRRRGHLENRLEQSIDAA